MSYDDWLVQPWEDECEAQREAEFIASCTCQQCFKRADAPLDDDLCDICWAASVASDIADQRSA